MLSRIFSFLTSLGFTFFILGCSSSYKPLTPKEADSIGQIIDLKTNQLMSVNDLLSRLSTQDYILIGEEHDNQLHHQIELYLFNQLTQKTRVHLLALEMLNVEQQPFINDIQFNRRFSLSDSELRKAIRWKSWDWAMYRDLIVESLQSKSHLIATNLTDREVEILLQGALPLSGTFSTSNEVKQKIAQLVSSISHHSPSSIENMVAVQQFRDRRMAEQLIKNALFTSILIAGNHHVNKEFGVPLHIAEYDKTKKVAVLMLKTRKEDITSSQADYLWLTK
ncbi:iron-regulated lipoprotein [Mannheimia granulomatis]|uniref:Iron-regulated lipoprotein n=1 Tax=Mannheimia granulomatis TaxID=85402 RepID=A0A6G8JGF6_9PAST|nr:ChaN family lipoprotein [Mannheimia granulomatis]QIM65938.1 iron-regulated lipoprotein [Mannheimia granulomatis]